MALFGSDTLFDAFNETKPGNEERLSSNKFSLPAEEENIVDEIERQKQENLILRSENERLKGVVKTLSKPHGIQIDDVSKDGPIVQLLMFNHILSRKHHENIKQVMHDILQHPITSDDDDESLKISHKNTFHLLDNSAPEVAKEAYRVFSSLQIYKEFYLDQIGEPVRKQLSKNGKGEVPDYDRDISGIMTNDPDEPLLTEAKKVGRICFNCGNEGHQLKDCKAPRNFKNISRRREEFNDKFDSPMRLNLSSRYHVDEDKKDEHEFKDFKPGIISNELRDALGLLEEDIPPYIYEMRRMGYPPGHLEEARVVRSGLALYEEKDTPKSRKRSNNSGLIDVDKFITFPGFNTPPLPGRKDIFHEINAHPLDEGQSLTVMKSYYQHRNSLSSANEMREATEVVSKRRKTMPTIPDDDHNVVDMEVTDDEAEPTSEVIDIEDGEIDEGGKVHIVDDNQSPEEGEVHVIDDNQPPEEEEEEIDVGFELGDLSEEELQIKMDRIKRQLEKTVSNENDVVDLTSSPDVIVVDDDSSETNSVAKDPLLRKSSSDTDWRVHTPIEKQESQDTDWRNDQLIKQEKTNSSDTDWRRKEDDKMHSSNNAVDVNDTHHDAQIEIKELITRSETTNRNVVNDLYQTENEQSVENIKLETTRNTESASDMANNSDLNTSDLDLKGLPRREQFAAGISQFDEYYKDETKSRGVYKKLRNILKK